MPVAGSYDSGIYYFGGRYYDQSLGIFIQKDPMMQHPSPYLYTNGNPVNRIDPTGLVDETNMPDFYYQWMKNGGHSFGGMTVGAPQLAQLAGQQGVSLRSTTIYASAGVTKTDMVAAALKFILGSASNKGQETTSSTGSNSRYDYVKGKKVLTNVKNAFISSGWGDVLSEEADIRFMPGDGSAWGAHKILKDAPSMHIIELYGVHLDKYSEHNFSSSMEESMAWTLAHEMVHHMMAFKGNDWAVEHPMGFYQLTYVVFQSAMYPNRQIDTYFVNQTRSLIGY